MLQRGQSVWKATRLYYHDSCYKVLPRLGCRLQLSLSRAAVSISQTHQHHDCLHSSVETSSDHMPISWKPSECSCHTKIQRSAMLLTRQYSGKSNEPLPFLKSKAGRFKVDNAYSIEPKGVRRQRYALPLGITIFGVIMYFGFIRQYGEMESSAMGFLTQDIHSKLPEGTRERMQQLEKEQFETVAEPSNQENKP